jgi:hypothetical protein
MGGLYFDWIGPYDSGEEITLNHTWSREGTYTIKARAKDTDNLWGPWAKLTVTMPRNRIFITPFLRFLQQHPYLFSILQLLLQRLGLQ